MDTMIFAAQALLTSYLAAWLALGLRDNLLHPSMNGAITTEILQLDRLREAYPESYKLIAHRRVTKPALQRSLFCAIVLLEAVVCVVLWAGVIWMVLAFLGHADATQAKVVALAGALGFTSIWCGFLIVGNHFAYWCCHETAQNTHFQMALWGIGTMVFLSV